MNSLFNECVHSDQQVWMIVDYRMDRIKLKNFFVRDQFSEPGYASGDSRVYFWQHRDKKGCTMKLRASVTDSNAEAKELLQRFISIIPNPNAIKPLDKSSVESEWFKNTEAESVHMFHPNDTDVGMVFLVWGNIFFHIESIGEDDHSVFELLKDLGNIWVDRNINKDAEPKFSLFTDRTEIRYDEEISLRRRGRDQLPDYYAYLYVASPKEHVSLYRKNGVIRLKVNAPDNAGEQFNPYAQLIGLCPDGQFVEGERLEFSVDQGGG